MTSLERMSCLVDHDIYDNSVPCMDDGCHGFRAGKQLAAACVHYVNFSFISFYLFMSRLEVHSMNIHTL